MWPKCNAVSQSSQYKKLFKDIFIYSLNSIGGRLVTWLHFCNTGDQVRCYGLDMKFQIIFWYYVSRFRSKALEFTTYSQTDTTTRATRKFVIKLEGEVKKFEILYAYGPFYDNGSVAIKHKIQQKLSKKYHLGDPLKSGW